MATYGVYHTIPGLVATGDLSSYQYYLVKLASTAGACKVSAATTDYTIGVLQNDPGDGEAAEVAAIGIVKAKAGAATTAGVFQMANSTGYVTDVNTTGRIVAFALEASATAGSIIRVVLCPGSKA